MAIELIPVLQVGSCFMLPLGGRHTTRTSLRARGGEEVDVKAAGGLTTWTFGTQKIADQTLVGGLEHGWIMTFHILEMSSSQLTNSYYFSEGLKPPTRTACGTLWLFNILLNMYMAYMAHTNR